MDTTVTRSLETLYLEDETAWLDAMADLVRRRDVERLDLENLGEFLESMANRDRREVKNRLVVLLAHLLKWEFQPEKRSRSGKSSVHTQRRELADLASRGVLRAHAESVLEPAYQAALETAATETGLARDAFPPACPYALSWLFEVELSDETEV
jgi:hypothetical protein